MGWASTLRVWLPAWLRDPAGVIESVRVAMTAPALPRPIAPTAPDAAATPIAGTPAGTPAIAEPVAIEKLVLPEFTPAADSVIASQSVLNNLKMATPAIERMAGEILDAEGPVPLARLLATIARRFGYARIGDGKKRDIAEVVEKSFLVVDGFVWPNGLDPILWRGARRSPSTAVRPLSDVSPQEMANVAERVTQEALSISADDLFKETSEVLGYGRLTEQVRSLLQAGLDLAISQGRIRLDGDRYLPA